MCFDTAAAAAAAAAGLSREKDSLLSYQPVALHLLRPADPKHVHEFVAVALGLQTEAAAGQSHPAVLCTHGGVERAQEHPEVRRALQVHHGVERLQVEKRERFKFY